MQRRYFNEEHLLLRDMVREFATSEVEPLADELDKESRFPSELIKQMAELGLMGLPVPTEFGGAGMDNVAFVIAVHELAKVDASVAITMAAHISLGSMPILAFGDENQKQKYLPRLTSGEILGAFGLTEPGAGSDAGATATTAVLKGDRYIVNGEKSFCTNAGQAGVITFTAKVIKDGQVKGINAFVIDADTPGLRVGPPEKKMGWRASDTRSLYFDDMELGSDNQLGSADKGFKQFLQTLTGGRISIGAMGLGTGEGAYLKALAYSKEREAFGHSISHFQGIQFKLADMATQLEAAKHLVYHAAWLRDQGHDVRKEAAMAKLFATELAMKITIEAIQIHGGYGYIREYQVERFFRDAKVLEIGEGSSEVQRMIIARQILTSQESL